MGGEISNQSDYMPSSGGGSSWERGPWGRAEPSVGIEGVWDALDCRAQFLAVTLDAKKENELCVTAGMLEKFHGEAHRHQALKSITQKPEVKSCEVPFPIFSDTASSLPGNQR